MEPHIKKRLEAMGAMAASGYLGADAQAEAQAIAGMNSTEIALRTINNLYAESKSQGTEILRLVDLLVQVILVVYREAKRKDLAVAEAIANSLIKDYPGAPGSCLLPKFDNLTQVSLAFKETPKQNRLVVWQQSKSLVEASNEFLNGLLGFLLAGWRCVLNRPIKPTLFKNAYGAKMNELATLSNGEDGIFYAFIRLSQYPLRNAIAHGDIWLNSDESKVEYMNAGESFEMGLEEFVLHSFAGSWLGRAYMGAIAAILVFETGNVLEIMQLPHHLSSVFYAKVADPAATDSGT